MHFVKSFENNISVHCIKNNIFNPKFYLVIFTFILWGWQLSSQENRTPNFVIIMADDMGYSDIGCFGATIFQTPNLDKISNEGLKMKNFSNTGKCHTSRVSLLSGLWDHQAGSSKLTNAVPLPILLKKRRIPYWYDWKMAFEKKSFRFWF